MHEQITRNDGMEVHKFTCDEKDCLRRAFQVIPQGSDQFYQIPGWTGIGSKNAEHVSELKHYCRKHPINPHA